MSYTRGLLVLTTLAYATFFALYSVELVQPEDATALDDIDDAEECGFFQGVCGFVSDVFDFTGSIVPIARFMLVLATFDTFTQDTDIPNVISVVLFLMVGLGWILTIFDKQR